MKRKIVIVAILLVLVLLCLTACNPLNETLEHINTLLKGKYVRVVLNVSTETSQVTLNGEYIFTFVDDKTTVQYTYDQLNGLSIDGDNADSYLQTIKGSCVVHKDGTMTSDDVSVDLPLPDVGVSGLHFEKNFFNNIIVSDNAFEADVTNPKGFTGNNSLTCTNMHVVVNFSVSSLYTLVITYVSENNANVTVSYEFSK